MSRRTTSKASRPRWNSRRPAWSPRSMSDCRRAAASLPGVLLARALGRQDCLGTTMALRRDTLARIGGLRALVDHLADDNALGRLVQGLGLKVRLAHTIPATTVPETTLRALAPAPFAASVLQYPLAWALLACVLSGGAIWSLVLFLATWLVRAVLAR